MRWSDLNFELRTVRVTSKPELGFYPKRWEDREIPAPVELIEELRKHTHRPNCQFVFPSPTGNREQHMLDHCKSIAKRAKLDATKFDLKTFRSTYATGMLRRHFDVRTVQHILVVGCLALAAGLTQSGCGGSKKEPASASTSAPAPAKPAEKPDNRPVIVTFGDSLTAGFGAEPGYSYPDFLQKDLDAAHLAWRVVNAGVSGDTTTDGLNRLPEVLALKPRVVILEFGGNDGLRGLPLETTRSNLDQMIAGLQSGGARVVLAGMTLPPNYGPEYISGFEKIYKDLAAKYKPVLIPFLLEGVATNPSLMQRDLLHPTAQGNEIVARTVLRYVKPLLD